MTATTPTNQPPNRLAEVPAAVILDVLFKKLGVTEVCRQVEMTEDELWQLSADELDRRADALPPGASAGNWEPGRRLDQDETRMWRLIHSAERTVTDHQAHIWLRAVHYSDGSLEDVEIMVETGDDSLNSDQARELAAALLEAAAELDGWTR